MKMNYSFPLKREKSYFGIYAEQWPWVAEG